MPVDMEGQRQLIVVDWQLALNLVPELSVAHKPEPADLSLRVKDFEMKAEPKKRLFLSG